VEKGEGNRRRKLKEKQANKEGTPIFAEAEIFMVYYLFSPVI
jgi:hypothetical protein